MDTEDKDRDTEDRDTENRDTENRDTAVDIGLVYQSTDRVQHTDLCMDMVAVVVVTGAVMSFDMADLVVITAAVVADSELLQFDFHYLWLNRC